MIRLSKILSVIVWFVSVVICIYLVSLNVSVYINILDFLFVIFVPAILAIFVYIFVGTSDRGSKIICGTLILFILSGLVASLYISIPYESSTNPDYILKNNLFGGTTLVKYNGGDKQMTISI